MAHSKPAKPSEKRILQELADIGFAKATDYLYVDEDRLCIRPTEELTDREAAAIASIERTSSGVKVKFYDKLKALELLGKHIGMFDGKGAASGESNNLLEAIVASSQEVMDTHDLPELQQAPAAGSDLVESAGSA